MIPGTKWSAWIVGAVLALLTAAVAVQGYMLYNLQRTTTAEPLRVERAPDPARPAAPAPPPSVSRQPSKPDDEWDDWFAFPPFDDEWDPFAEMERMREHMMRLFDDSFHRFGRSPFALRDRAFPRAFSPSADIEDRGDRYVVRMDLPGVEKSDISVGLNGQTLTVSGKTSEVKDERDPAGRILRQERRSGQFQRVMTLPGPVQSEKMEAKYADGVLTITVPKADPKAEPRRVTVI